MRKFSACAFACAFLFVSVPANGSEIYTFLHHHHHIYRPPVKPPVVSEPVKPGGGGAWKFTCWMNPAAIELCIIAFGIVGDKVKRAIEGPDCATMKPRQSWFGMTPDTPEIWRPLCNWKDPISVRG